MDSEERKFGRVMVWVGFAMTMVGAANPQQIIFSIVGLMICGLGLLLEFFG